MMNVSQSSLAETNHPWSNALKLAKSSVTAPEFVIDNLISTGAVAIAGYRGVGKTSSVLPLVMLATHLVENEHLKATIRRKVFYISEDPEQVLRIIEAMFRKGVIKGTKIELDKMLQIIPAKRIQPHRIAEFIQTTQEDKCANKRADSTYYHAPPVVVLDTVNATVDLDNVNDNSEVSRAISKIRAGAIDANIILVGHVSKSTKANLHNTSFMGAGAWENDTQQTLYLSMEGRNRSLSMGKKRFECQITDYRIEPIRVTLTTQDKLGQDIQLDTIFGRFTPLTAEDKAKAKMEKDKINAQNIESKIMQIVQEKPGIPKTELRQQITGGAQAISDAITRLEQENKITFKQSGRIKSYYSVPETSSDN